MNRYYSSLSVSPSESFSIAMAVGSLAILEIVVLVVILSIIELISFCNCSSGFESLVL